MRKILLFPLLFLFAGLVVWGQEKEPILTKKQNRDWLEKVSQQELPQQLETIKARIFADTMVVYHPSALPHNLSSNQDKQLRTDCRPVYLYRKSSGKSFPLGANPGKDLVNALDALLTPRHISEVIILIDQKETALYGSRGNCGVVKLTFKDSRAFEELQNLTSK